MSSNVKLLNIPQLLGLAAQIQNYISSLAGDSCPQSTHQSDESINGTNCQIDYLASLLFMKVFYVLSTTESLYIL